MDLAVQNDVTYHYVVRARLASGGAQSIPSPVAAATPEDATPPAQPRGLVAVVAGSAIRLAWEAVPDADVAGYLVYRSTTAGRGHTPLTPVAAGRDDVRRHRRAPGAGLLLRRDGGRPVPPRQRVRPSSERTRDRDRSGWATAVRATLVLIRPATACYRPSKYGRLR